MPKAVIVGAGINGLASARALLRRGWTVEVLDRGPIPNPEAASWDRHRLIRAQYAGFPGYAARLPQAFAAWERLWADLGRSHYVERGVLALSRREGDWTDRARDAFAAGGVACELLAPEEVAARFPAFDVAEVRYGLFSPGGGVLLSDRILEDLAGWLVRAGACLRPGFPVDRIDPALGRAAGPAGTAEGDVVLVAAGIGLPALAPDLAAFRPHRTTVLYLDPPSELAQAWRAAPAWIDLGGEDELWGMPPVAGIPLKLGFGRLTAPGDPFDRVTTEAEVAAILCAYHGRLIGTERFALRAAVTNFYLMAPDERFLLRRDRRAVILSADSGHGFKFGALTGEDVAEALDGGDLEAVSDRIAGLEAA